MKAPKRQICQSVKRPPVLTNNRFRDATNAVAGDFIDESDKTIAERRSEHKTSLPHGRSDLSIAIYLINSDEAFHVFDVLNSPGPMGLLRVAEFRREKIARQLLPASGRTCLLEHHPVVEFWRKRRAKLARYLHTRREHFKGPVMQVSSTNQSAFTTLLENTAKTKFEGNKDKDSFSFALDQSLQSDLPSRNSNTSQVDPGKSPGSSGSNGDWEFTGSNSSSVMIAVGHVQPDGTIVPFSQQQIQSEYDAVNNARLAAYDSTLKNFMMLSQAGGQLGAGTITDHQEFMTANGLVSGHFDTSFSLNKTS